MSKRATIHVPSERHRQLREIATRKGFATITDFLDDLIGREAAALGIDSGLIAITPMDGGNVRLSIDGLPELVIEGNQLPALATEVAATVSRMRLWAGWGLYPHDGRPGIEFRRQGRGFLLKVVLGPRERPIERGFTESLAREFAARLANAATKPLTA